ncbi:MAG: acyltransferase [bacterium]|nr:acyltransferase [bacterium]
MRTVAVAGVLYAHSVRSDIITGHWGVQLFFVISGFLITGLLLDGRGTGNRRDAKPLRNFYIRRILRLWPAYYAILFVALALNWESIRLSAAWHIFYGTNIYYYLNNTYDPWIVDHFWSLDVEEQYYLVWPFIIYGCRRAALPYVIFAIMLMSWLGNVLADPLGWNRSEIGVDALLPFSLTALSAGSMLALLYRTDRRLLRFLPWIGAIGAALWIAIMSSNGIWSIWAMPFEVLVWTTIVHLAARGMPGPIGVLLASPPVRYCGMVSYGIYLYHGFIIFLLGEGWLFGHQFTTGHVMFTLTTLFSLIAASLSWYLLESPVNQFKHRFPYPRGAGPTPATTPPIKKKCQA